MFPISKTWGLWRTENMKFWKWCPLLFYCLPFHEMNKATTIMNGWTTADNQNFSFSVFQEISTLLKSIDWGGRVLNEIRNLPVLCRKPCRKCLTWTPNRPVSRFSGVRPDGDHAATPAVHQRRPGSDLNGHHKNIHSSVRWFDWDILVHLSHSIISGYWKPLGWITPHLRIQSM